MKTDVIQIDNQSNGFAEALAQAEKAAEYKALNQKDALHLRILTEEMLSLVSGITGELKVDFWIEILKNKLELHLTTVTEMTQEKRELLLETASSGHNDAAGTFLGKLRDLLEQATVPSAKQLAYQMPDEVISSITGHIVIPEDLLKEQEQTVVLPRWDGYEKSILQSIADDVSISIRGNKVHIRVSAPCAG